MLYFIVPAIGATYLKVSPIKATLVFDLEVAAANTSAKCVDFSADMPKAVRASVTMSDTLARLSPDAPARFIIPAIPSSICLSSQPAIAMYCIAWPASVAENWVVAPISFALVVSFSRLSPEAPDMACTVLICAWKFL